jgi:guanosine-3',5'-bis(diphosphate) 3'-pyrophosphohydrolase
MPLQTDPLPAKEGELAMRQSSSSIAESWAQEFKQEDISLLLKAVKFSAEKHKTQRRKGAEGSPYINHPIDVAEMLWNAGSVRDIHVIVAAILHDTVEDTRTTPAEIEEHFGPEVRSLVQEVTDDRSLPKPERKRLQIEHAPHLSVGAKQLKLADKISNIHDVAFAPPADWSYQRRVDYVTWADRVVNGLRGCNEGLEQLFDKTISRARSQLHGETTNLEV